MAAIFYSGFVLVILLSSLSATDRVKECPPWFTLDEDTRSSLFPKCGCSDAMEYEMLCDQRKKTSFVRLGFCAHQDSTTNDTVVAQCPYVFPRHLIEDELIRLPNKSSELNQFICGNLNRNIGTPLCGRCISGTGPSIYSVGSQCVSCSAVNIVYYLLLRYLPTTVFFVIIIVFRINITTAPMAHYVLFCNSIVMFFKSIAGLYTNTLHTVHVLTVWKFLLTLNAIWTLDFFYFLSPPLCVSVHMEEIYIPLLDAIATLYPFALLLLTYVGIELHAHDFKPVVCLRRPIHRTYVRFRRTWDPNANLIQAFATLFFLSYTKFILLMYEALFISDVINTEDKILSRVCYIDPTVLLFSHKHYYLLILSVFILTFIILPPSLLLIIFPTCLFKKVSRFLRPRWIVSIKTFVDTFHGCLKDGTNGTQDYRAVAGYILTIWAFLPAVEIVITTLTNKNEFLPHKVFILFYIALTVLCALLRPYKHKTANFSGILLPAFWASAITLWIIRNTEIATTSNIGSCVLLSLPHCVFYGYIVYRFGKLLKRHFCKTREIQESVNERLPCRPPNYCHLIEVSTKNCTN